MTNIQEYIPEFLGNLERQGIKKIIAFSGGADDNLESKVLGVVEQSMDVLSKYPVAILTGGTKWGLPKYASRIAKNKSIPTIGVYPNRGKKYALAEELDFTVEVDPRYGSSEWGDESEIFAKLVNGIEVIGGGFGTLIEFAHVMKSNEAKIKSGVSPVYIAPVRFAEMSSVADVAYNFCRKPELSICLPEKEIVSDGIEAANFLVDKLSLK